jgi:hypothetical protein
MPHHDWANSIWAAHRSAVPAKQRAGCVASRKVLEVSVRQSLLRTRVVPGHAASPGRRHTRRPGNLDLRAPELYRRSLEICLSPDPTPDPEELPCHARLKLACCAGTGRGEYQAADGIAYPFASMIRTRESCRRHPGRGADQPEGLTCWGGDPGWRSAEPGGLPSTFCLLLVVALLRLGFATSHAAWHCGLARRNELFGQPSARPGPRVPRQPVRRTPCIVNAPTSTHLLFEMKLAGSDEIRPPI